MPDTRDGRDEQARNEERRQREREIREELERADEPEPPVEAAELDEVETDLDGVDFPASGTDVVAAVGDREVSAPDRTYAVAEVVPESDAVQYENPAAVSVRLRRPAVAAAVKRIVEAGDSLPHATLGVSQREAYEKTLRELEAIDEDDEDEGIRVVTDWIVEQIREKETFPGSRAVRKRGAAFCRANGYEVRNDEWLGA